MEKSAASETFWTEAHAWLAYGLAGLVLLHTGAALFHHFWRRDEVLKRMLGILRHPAASHVHQPHEGQDR